MSTTLRTAGISQYLLNGFLLIIPALVVNLLWVSRLWLCI
jgi:hypothetical protein